MDKKIKWSKDCGWFWHKSWNLPKITVRVGVILLNNNLRLKKKIPSPS